MNSHLPVKRRKLSQLLSEQEPQYKGRDGGVYSMSRQELETIDRIVRTEGVGDIKLPILLMADPSMAQSAWRVEGRAECVVISGILGRNDPEQPDRLVLYAPHVAVLIRKLPTTTVSMYLG